MSSRKRQPAKPKKQSRPGFFYTLTGFLFGWIKHVLPFVLIIFALGLGYLAASIYLQARDLPDVTTVERYEPIEAVQILDRNDHLVCLVEGDENRQVVPLGQISLLMQRAMLAAEDHHFFEHHGVNVGSILRALMVNAQAGHVVEGGSTITQQLVKNLFFTQAGRTYNRKLKEVILAFELEQRYPKDKILELYLNQIYFGSNAYGIERAAARYFNKTALKLNLGEAAFLAGLVKAPSELGDPHNRSQAIARQHEILDKMVEYGYVTTSQRKAALATKLVFRNGSNPFSHYPYYISYVLQLLHEKYSENDIRKQGLRVYTNLDQKAEQLAESTLAESIKNAPKGVTQAALVSISVSDGAVLALVGGVGDFWKNQFNRATNPHTVGSSFKPFVYLTAFLNGAATPDSPIDDSPLVVHQGWGMPDYCPKNFDHKFYGRIPVRKALALSRNIPSLRMAQKVGISNVIETARLAGIRAKLDPNLSLALGSSAISPLDMAAAYSTFARDGMAMKPVVIRRIENNNKQVIDSCDEQKTRVFPSEPVAELVNVLQDVIKYGTGTQAKLPDRPVAGKTGTADEGKDIWFIGFTPDLVTAVWGGNDENLPIPGHNVTGGVVMAKIWQKYNTAYYKTYPTPPGSFFTYDPKLAQQKVNEANKALEKQNPVKPNEQLSQTADFLQPHVEKIDETKDQVVEKIDSDENKGNILDLNSTNKDRSSPSIKLVPQQASAQLYKPTVEPIEQVTTPVPAPAPELHAKAKQLMPAPPVPKETAPLLAAPSQATIAPAATTSSLSSTPEKILPAPTGRRLYPYQPKTNFAPPPQ